MSISQQSSILAQQTADLLKAKGTKIAFAESCTCGLVAVTLGSIPGISDVLCGSTVTYRDMSKSGWLGVDPKILADPTITAVSDPVARQMASGVLKMTPEANLAVSVTGHLGPNAPENMDGLAFVGFMRKEQSECDMLVHRIELPEFYPAHESNVSLRTLRQEDLLNQILTYLIALLDQST